MVSRRLQDSVNRLFSKAVAFIEDGKYDRALASLKDVEKIMKKEKDPATSFHTLFLKGYTIGEKLEIRKELWNFIRRLSKLSNLCFLKSLKKRNIKNS